MVLLPLPKYVRILQFTVQSHFIIHHMCMWYLPVKYANIRIANFGSIIAVSDTCVATSNGSDILKESDISSVEFILFWKESYTVFCVTEHCVVLLFSQSMYCRCLFNSSLWRTEVRWRTGGRGWSQQDVSPSLSQSPGRDEASHLQRRPELGSGKFRVQRLPWSLEVLINVVCDFRTGLYSILSLLIIPQPAVTMDPQ